jgi:hypothetical protein
VQLALLELELAGRLIRHAGGGYRLADRAHSFRGTRVWHGDASDSPLDGVVFPSSPSHARIRVRTFRPSP